MNYELTKKLKDAGFPFKIGLYEYRHCEGHIDDKDSWDEYMGKCAGYGDSGKCSCICHSIPTLSELIEACGDSFYSINKRNKGDYFCIGNKTGIIDEGDYYSTPEEAIANLWLALKENKGGIDN